MPNSKYPLAREKSLIHISFEIVQVRFTNACRQITEFPRVRELSTSGSTQQRKS